ncbi:MAG: SDR family NAD(P)-dependent oxidoreductase [Anaerolineae bacterium]|uniref:SDR family NAD(P)-dependent oxidoreductase n=1 Tax=Promineifilum sp. TaxID=2664178 RepID=UPI001D301A53|nr:SDR family NAD(P)-dependent oxidoreductase [Anaerolineales bacterium]MCB8935593.1 SDR family NAD(P)-dependent oxidoreductase [Promineifilum sp.]MCO5180610.1 SDR family NAD(P)-dependent oxidoreductase [Promineifilum sp.]MCW5847663.1 SDR family NAD(P)-dependent oxidoreductase [Anaerolineae bacterium]
MSEWTGKRALVTGAGGFIGSQLTESLVRDGVGVRAFIRYTSRGDAGLLGQLPREIRDEVEIVAGDLRDTGAIDAAVSGVDVVYHLGAIISIPYSYKHPMETAETNFMGTLNVLMACRAHNVERLVHTSTSEVYGTAQFTPMDERHPLQGQSPYSASKIGADKLVESFYRAYNLPAVTLRPFNTYGPRQSARAVIPTIITQALTSDCIQLGNLDARRDFTYVRDTVSGFMRAAAAPDVLGRELNLGTGMDISVGELADLIIRLVGRPVAIATDSERLRPEKSEVGRLLSDNGLARRALGWEPTYSLEEGLRETIAWIGDHLDFYRVGRYEI